MRCPRPRFTLGRVMTLVILVALLMAWIASHRDRLRNGARAGYLMAKHEREIAEVALAGYMSIHEQDLKTMTSEIALAESEVKQAEEPTERSGLVSRESQFTDKPEPADILAAHKARSTPEQARARKAVLEKSTHPKRLKELKGEVAKARATEAARKAMLEHQEANLISTWDLR